MYIVVCCNMLGLCCSSLLLTRNYSIFSLTIQVVTASSFHHSENNATNNNNALLNAKSARTLKTETSIGCDEFQEFEFRDQSDNDNDNDDVPSNVREEVTLVFGLREAKVRACV